MNRELYRALANKDPRRMLRSLAERPLLSGPVGPLMPQAQQLTELLIRGAHVSADQRRLQSELCSLALTDELTGLFNRRSFLLLAGQQLKLARRKSRGALLFFFDVDGLKEINDSRGHMTGDRALLGASSALRATFRDSDILARFGGDEFAVLALEASDHNEATMAARLRQNLGRHNAKESQFRLSLSMGVARLTAKASLEELLAFADRAMYEQKRGRMRSPNRAVPQGSV